MVKKLFAKKKAAFRQEMPSWEEIVAHMQNQTPTYITDTVVRRFVSQDGAKQILILRSAHGYYKISYLQIALWDEDRWRATGNGCYPAWWNPVASPLNSPSFYGTEEEAVSAAVQSPEYQADFA